MKISTVIPAYNAEPWIAEAITSVQAQSRPGHELIVVDDGSSDRTAEIARSLGATVLQLETNSGDAVARNAGLRHASGDVIAWLDADDYWAPDHLEVLLGLLEQYPQASVACAATQRFGLLDDYIPGYVPDDGPADVFWEAAYDWLHPTIGAVIRRSALQEIWGLSALRRASTDYDMWLRLARRNLFVATRQVTSHWRWHSAQQSRNYAVQLSALYFFQRYFLDSELIGKAPADAERFAGIMRKRWTADFNKAMRAGDHKLALAVYEERAQIPDLDPDLVQNCHAALLRVQQG